MQQRQREAKSTHLVGSEVSLLLPAECVGVFSCSYYLKKRAKAEVSNHRTSNTRVFLYHLTQSLGFLPQQNFQTTFFNDTINCKLVFDLTLYEMHLLIFIF